MSIPIWPPGLPQSAAFPTSEECQPNYIETDMEGGFQPKRRPRTTGQTSKFSVTVTGLSDTQRQLLKDFYFITCHGGADPFTWKNPQTSETALCVFDGALTFAPTSLAPKTYDASFNMRIDP